MINLHRHDSYSQLDGVGTPSQYAKIAADFGQPALGIANHGSINGALAHRKACNENGIIPIVGCECYFRPNRLVREKEWRYRKWHLVVIAKSLVGWHNLIRLTSCAYADGMYQFPCVDWDLLDRYHEGLICTTSCILGPLPFLIENAVDAQVDAWMARAQGIFGDDLFCAVQPHDFDRQRQVNLSVVSLAAKYGAPVIYEGDSHYPYADWDETQKIAILVGTNTTLAEAEKENAARIARGEEVYELWHEGLHMMDEAEVRRRFAEFHPNLPQQTIDEAISSTDEVLARVEPYLMDRTLKMPRSREGEDPRETVLSWCREGLERIGKDGDPLYLARLDYEVDVIGARSAFPYFALVGDVVRWARTDEPLPPTPDDPDPPRKRPIRLNTRGSAAASLVCYLSRISTLDPIAHKFKFERFMNPERRSLPDVDLDIASTRRGELKEYVARKYGRSSVADVVAQQHWQPRAALQLVTKTIYGYDSEAYREVARLTHQDTGVVDAVHDVDLDHLREREPELARWAEAFPDAFEQARRLENAGDPSVLRMSKHAAAVLILPGDVTEFVPTIKASDEEVGVRTAWAETSRVSIVDEIGVVKMDFLGLKGMDQQQMIVDMIAEHTGEAIDLDELGALRDPYDVEDDVMDIFRRGLTLGVNQFSGAGVTEFMRRAAPDNVVDLTAINALYRPGPLGSGAHNRYAKRKRGEAYELHPLLVPVLGDTYGSECFQEQIMELFQVLVGYSAGQADLVRKEIDKLNRSKNPEGRKKLAERRDEFVAAAAERLESSDLAEELWQAILPFTGYAFARPHSGSYAAQAFQDGWLKRRYSLFAFAVMLTMEEDKTAEILREGRSFGVSVLPPDVNLSGDGFTVDREANAIRYGLRGIKGIGDAVAKQVLADRPFSDLADFELRSSCKYSKVNKKAREILARVGALDSLGARDDWTPVQRAQAEQDLLGVALEPGGLLGEDSPIVRENVFTEQEVADAPEGSRVVIGGKIEVRRTRVKKGQQIGREMAMLTVTLDLDRWRAVCFPDVWDQYRSLIESGEMLMLAGKRGDRGDVKVTQAMLLRDFVAEARSEQVAA